MSSRSSSTSNASAASSTVFNDEYRNGRADASAGYMSTVKHRQNKKGCTVTVINHHMANPDKDEPRSTDAFNRGNR